MGLGLDGMGVDHRGSHIAVAHHLLNGANVVIGLQQVAGETVAEGVGRGALGDFRLFHRQADRFLHMGFMQMVAAKLLFIRHQR